MKVWRTIQGDLVADLGRVRIAPGGQVYLKLWVNHWWTGWTWVRLTDWRGIKRFLDLDADRDA